MAQNVFEDLVADGRLKIVPGTTHPSTVTHAIFLDHLATRLTSVLSDVYCNWDALRCHYSGTDATVTELITAGINSMVIYGPWCCYNRLRAVAECYSPYIKVARMNPRAPCCSRMVFPTLISSLLQSIGPLRISDAAADILVIYAPDFKYMENYGRKETQIPDEESYNQLVEALRACGAQYSPIDTTPNFGSFWTTWALTKTSSGLFNVMGTVHQSHYQLEDAGRAFVLDANQARNPFPWSFMSMGYVDDPVVLSALAAARPPKTPDSITADSPGRPVGFIYDVNWFGIQPGVAAIGNKPAKPRGCYILGRVGGDPLYTCYIARNVTLYEINAVLRDRLTR